MINLEKQKEHFKDHIATLKDYGNIKILDFKKPNSSEYRIRFLFEEDYKRLHISGDLGELIATNYDNMCYDKFSQFVDNINYFEEKIDCHSRAIYLYDYDKAKEDLKNELEQCEIRTKYDFETKEEVKQELIEEMMEDFDERKGFGSKAYDTISASIPDCWEWIGDIGKEETGILELYMLAFKLAQKQLSERT